MANEKSEENSHCNVYGAVPGVEVGTVFASRREFFQIHGSITPISVGPEGPYSILVLRSQNLTDHGCVFGFCTGESQKFQGDLDAEPEGEFNKNLVLSVKSRLPARILRASSLKNSYSPIGGFRYDGLYFCKGYQTEVVKNKLVFKFKMFRLEKQAPAPWETINQSNPAHISSDLEITHEHYSCEKSDAEKNAYNFQVNIQEYCYIKKEEPIDYSSDNEVDALSSSCSVAFHIDSDVFKSIPDRKPIILDSDQVYEVDADIDNESITKLLKASGLISKRINFPKSSIKIDVDMENDDIIVSGRSSCDNDDYEIESDSDDEMVNGISSLVGFHKPYQMDVEVDEKPLSHKNGQQYINKNCLISSEGGDRVVTVSNGVNNMDVNNDDDDEVSSIISPVDAIDLKSEPINDVELIVSDSPQEFNASMKYNSDSPVGSDQIEFINCNEDQSMVLSDLELPTITSYMSKNTDNEVQVSENFNYIIKQSNSPCFIDSSSDYDATEVVPTQTYLADQLGNTEILDENNLAVKQSPPAVKTSIANDCSINNEDNSEPLHDELDSATQEYISQIKLWMEKKDEIESKYLQAIGDSKHFFNKLTPLVEKMEKCQCAPSPKSVQSLLGSLSHLFYLYFSCYFCECMPKVSRKTQDNGYKCFKNILTKLGKHHAKRIKAIFAVIVLRTCNREELNEGLAILKNDERFAAISKPLRKLKILKKTVLTSDNGDKYDLIESEDGKFYLRKHSGNLSKSIPSNLEFNDIHTGNNAGNIISYDNGFGLIKSPRPRKVTRIASKRIVASEPATLTKKRGRLKQTKPLSLESPHHREVSLPSLALPQLHLLGFTGYEIKRSEIYHNNFEGSNLSYVHYPPKPINNFHGFNNYDIMRVRVSIKLFSSLEIMNQSYVYNNVKKKRRRVLT